MLIKIGEHWVEKGDAKNISLKDSVCHKQNWDKENHNLAKFFNSKDTEEEH